MTSPADTPRPPPDQLAAAGATAGQAKRARAARGLSSTGPLIAIIVLLAGAVGGLVLRDLNRLDADIAQLRVDMNAGFADVDARFDEFENDVNARFDEFENDVNARFGKVDARFGRVDARFDEISVKLTALIAALNKADEVDAALTGRLLTPDAHPVEPRSAQP